MKTLDLNLTSAAGLQIVLETSETIYSNHLIFFTDLDGTLLDHDSYSYQPAEEALAKLREREIPLILASSKTAAEIAPLRKELGFGNCEAIIENGAGILQAGSFDTDTNHQYQKLLDKIAKVPSKLRDCFTGFADLNAKKLSELTGLKKASAELAKSRQYSEPGIWSGSNNDLKVFSAILEEFGVAVQRGGRFLTLSFGGDKVDRMREIMEIHRIGARHRFCVALGDAPNDIGMLEAADLGIVIPNPSHSGVGKKLDNLSGNIKHAHLAGPDGWNTAVLGVLNTSKGGELSG